MRFDIITLFPHIFDSYLDVSILRRAREKNLISIHAHDLREWSRDKHKTVDDSPYGGGAGMVLKPEPILRAIEHVSKQGKKLQKQKFIILSAKGKPFNQQLANEWTKKYDRIIMLSGRYEGIDERVKTTLHAEEISIGPYVLTDGDLAAMAIVSAVSRLVPGVIKLQSLQEESHWNLLLKQKKNAKSGQGLEYPHYTRPEVITYQGKKFRVPKVLLSGDHKKIAAWRKKHSK